MISNSRIQQTDDVAQTLATSRFGSLQRKCGCGQYTIGGGQCGTCTKSGRTSFLSEGSRAGAGNSLPLVSSETLRSPRRSLIKSANAFTEPRLAHDFSGVKVQTSAPRTTFAQSAVNSSPADYMMGGFREVEQGIASLYDEERHCPPGPDSMKSVVGKGGAGTLGVTTLDKSSKVICAPQSVSVDEKAGTCTFKARPVSLSVTSKFAKPEVDVDTGITKQVSKCGDKQVPVFTTITQTLSDLVKQGEQEHCDDFNLAFNRTVSPCAVELAKLENQTFPAKNEGECYNAIFSKLGFDPIDCSQEFITLSVDQRDPPGWHSFDLVPTSEDCNKVTATNVKASTNKIGDPAVAPNKIIPTSTKCARPATPAPATSGSAPKQPTPAPTPKPPEEKPKEKPKQSE
jgi:hypothetical protein